MKVLTFRVKAVFSHAHVALLVENFQFQTLYFTSPLFARTLSLARDPESACSFGNEPLYSRVVISHNALAP
jgi:hypothetical protein